MRIFFILITIFGFLPGPLLAGEGSIRFDGEIIFRPPKIGFFQSLDLSNPDVILMNQGLDTPGARINLEIRNMRGESTGDGSGVMDFSNKIVIDNTQLQSFTREVNGFTPTGNGVNLYSGLQGMRGLVEGGHNIKMLLINPGF